MILALLRKWWPEIAAVCLLAFAVWQGYDWIYDQGARDERAMWLNKENRALVAVVAERDKALADRNAAQRRADKLAKLPAKVVTVVRNNPSNCSLPRPVTDSVRDQVRQTNSAIRSVR